MAAILVLLKGSLAFIAFMALLISAILAEAWARIRRPKDGERKGWLAGEDAP